MKIIAVKSLLPDVKSVLLFSENKKEDYLYAHQLSIAEDVTDDAEEIQARKYDSIPDETNVSDRYCYFK